MITIRGARTHNLKNISLTIPDNQITVITGVSGSGKSSLAFDTLFAEGQRRYLDALSLSARQWLDQLPRPDVDWISGLRPAIALTQQTLNASPVRRSAR
ncbi:ATP-binding cassette domain-containing protein [Hydrogenophilus thermoluteolus]|uniref:ATP-binding cassette domain-containing protein n=1 Tax=Hydrogenophilus thermoluteolus TaxID=297 RepID=UPI003F67BD76